jgi:hypothetical protein
MKLLRLSCDCFSEWPGIVTRYDFYFTERKFAAVCPWQLVIERRDKSVVALTRAIKAAEIIGPLRVREVGGRAGQGVG